jgi:hypothetical protein
MREIIENNRDKEEVERENMGLQTETATKEEQQAIMKVNLFKRKIKNNEKLRDKKGNEGKRIKRREKADFYLRKNYA